MSLERFATDYHVAKHSNLEYSLDYFLLTLKSGVSIYAGAIFYIYHLQHIRVITSRSPLKQSRLSGSRPYNMASVAVKGDNMNYRSSPFCTVIFYVLTYKKLSLFYNYHSH